MNLTFQGEQVHSSGTIVPFAPHAPNVILQTGITQRPAEPFSLDALGNPFELRDDRRKNVFLDPELIEEGGFGFVKVSNPDGNVTLAAGETLKTPALGSVELGGANVNVLGSIISPGGSIILKAYNISPTVSATLAILDSNDPLKVTPKPNKGRGVVSLGDQAVLDASGLLIDDRLSSPNPLSLPIVLNGGNIAVSGYTVNLAQGSVMDVSGGARMDWFGKSTYGNAGLLSIKAGQDISIAGVLGGQLSLGSTMRGFAGLGSKGGALEIQAPFVQIGGETTNPNVLLLQPDFFNQGGFASFAFTGIGSRADKNRTPGVLIAPGTEIAPVPVSQIIVPFGGGRDGLELKNVIYPESMRSAVSLSFSAPRQDETYTLVPAILVRGNVVMGENTSIQAGPLGSVGFKASTITLMGSVDAPGGSISIAGANAYPSIDPLVAPLTTVYLGPQARLSTAGKVELTPDAFGRRIGTVLAGGTISIGGNIVMEPGSVLDVSGATGVLDIAPAYLGLDANGDPINGLLTVPLSSGLTTPQYAYATEPVQVDSNGGMISLAGGEFLVSRAKLNGEAGGPTATGGTLLVSSGRFYAAGVDRPPSDANLTVTQTGFNLPSAFYTDGRSGVGRTLPGFNGGYFTVNDFIQGGFDNLQLGGNVNFKGPINIKAAGSLSVASGGFLYADSLVNLDASYVALGTAFKTPFQVGEVVQPFTLNGNLYTFAPTAGAGRLNVTADLIDIGNLTLGGIGKARLVADGGSIRGNGTFSMAGDLYLRAAQIYPTTGSIFTIAAYDAAPGDAGSVTIRGSGTVALPLSAGGTLNVYASTIDQGGVLRAPFGVINLGWDGTDTNPNDTIPITPPVNLVVGDKAALPVTASVILRSGSVTSVSAIDPLTGEGVLIPFGRFNAEQGAWIGPNGQNITVSGLPQKAVTIAGQSVDTQKGSVVDIRGGGDFYAYSWSPGLLGTRDLLGSAAGGWNATTEYQAGDLVTYRGQTWSAKQGSTGRAPSTGFFWTPVPQTYAVIPGYSDFYSPFAAFNATAESLLNDPGYVNSGLKVGDQVNLGTGSGLAAGTYTLLPARYALLPGAFLVTPQTGLPIGTFLKPDNASFVNGFRYNGLNTERDLQPVYSRWEVASQTTVRDRAAYADYFANSFLADYAAENNIQVQRLPQDSGQLVLAAVSAMNINGTVLAKPVGPGRGGLVDITSTSPIIIGNSSTPQVPGVLVLNAAQLSKFGAESLLIGGTRTLGADGASVNVRTSRITVSNQGAALVGSEIILVSNGDLLFDTTAVIRAAGSLSGAGDTLLLKGPGSLLRLSTDPLAQVVRTGVTGTSTTGIRIDSGAVLSGPGLTLDSTGLRDFISDGAILNGRNITINSGIMRLLLSDDAPTDQGLILGSSVLSQFQNAKSLSLLSYSTMDIYGSGTVGSSALANLSIHAAAIRRMGLDGVAAFEAQNILLDNSANITVTSSQLAGPLAGSLLFNSKTLTLGANQVQIAKFENLGLTATNGLFLRGTGGLTTPGSITATTPFIVSTQGSSKQSITAGKALTFDAGLPGPTFNRDKAGLGSSISLTGTSVTLGSDIILPSGIVNVTATTGALSVSGDIDVGGTVQTIYDLTRYTSGGDVKLSAAGGDITLATGGSINVAAMSGGGNAGSLTVSSPAGDFILDGTISGKAGAGGLGGSFSLDTKSRPVLSTIAGAVNSAGFNNILAFRVRTGDEVLVDGTTKARDFRLSVDEGAIKVTGTVDVSGIRGGSISMSAFKGLTLAGGSLLDASADEFNAAGKGGSIFLESRGASTTTWNGDFTNSIKIETNSRIDLSVAETPSLGDFSGTLHLRGMQKDNNSDFALSTINGTITGASSIIAEGFKIFDLSGPSGIITTAVQQQVFANGEAFLGTGGTTTAAYTLMHDRVLGSNTGLASVLTIRAGAEIINDGTFLKNTTATVAAGASTITVANATNITVGQLVTGTGIAANTSVVSVVGNTVTLSAPTTNTTAQSGVALAFQSLDLTLGTANSTANDSWNLSAFRFGPDRTPGVLTLRAKGDLNFFGSLSDGFQSAAYNAQLLNPSSVLPQNAQSWSYRLTAGADLKAADSLQVLAASNLTAGKGSISVGRFVTADAPGGSGQTASTAAALAGNYQVIRTGSGDIQISTGRDVRLLNQFATIYTAGTRVADPTLGGTFDVPNPSLTGSNQLLGNPQQNPAYQPQYSLAGGNITINAEGDIGHFKKDISQFGTVLIADSSLQMPTNWLYRRGYIDPLTGQFGTASVGTDVASTTWWVDFSNFFQGVGALGGGNITMNAGGNVSNVDAVIPTNARMPKGTPDMTKLVELGGGDLTVNAKGDIDAGVYYVERGRGILQAGGSITTNSTRRAIPGVNTPESRLPTTLFVGKSSFKIEARGDVLLGPISNPFMLPGGINNSVWYKSYFSTYGADSGVEATSLGGDITFRQSVVKSGSTITSPILLEWYRNVLQYNAASGTTPSSTQPWLRLNETDVGYFSDLTTVGAASLRLTALAGDINLVGRYSLFPSSAGNLSLEARGAINGLQPLGTVRLAGVTNAQTVWTASQINLSDADPALVPGAATPVAYRAFTATEQDRTTASLNFLATLSSPFAESGSLVSSVSTQQTLHASNLLHKGDTNLVHIYAEGGDISGLTLFAPKAARIVADRDITDIAFYLQNTADSDLTIVSAGRDLLLYNPSSPLRSLVNQTDNLLANAQPTALAGDIQIGGPGTLEVLAGHDIKLGNGASFDDGTGAGITSIGNARNPALIFDGSSVVVAAGIGPSFGLANSGLDFDAFISKFLTGTEGDKTLAALSAVSDITVTTSAEFKKLSDDEQKRIALQAFFIVLRNAGRDHNLAGSPGFGNYTAGINAIAALFPDSYTGKIETNSRDIRTKSGGDISMLIPGGGLTLQTLQTGSRSVPPGIVTESGGNIHIFTDQGVNIGISRIFTLRGGSQVIWASTGDIAAGSSSKTVQSAPPTRVLIDPTSADVATDLAGLATGGGIGVLATVAGVPPGSVDLIAVLGAIDAGDAGIRATGNLNIAAVQVLNASNISVSGASSGTPAAPAVSVPNVSVASAGSAAAAATTQATQPQTGARNEGPPPATEEVPSIVTVEVIGYGGGDGEEDEEEKRRKKAAEQSSPGAQVQ